MDMTSDRNTHGYMFILLTRPPPRRRGGEGYYCFWFSLFVSNV